MSDPGPSALQSERRLADRGCCALENLQAEVIDIEALACAAESAANAFPRRRPITSAW